MPGPGSDLIWFSPNPRAVLLPGDFHVSRSLRRSRPRFQISFDGAFERVMRACASPARPHGWIDRHFIGAYVRLFEMGWAQSVECWFEGELVGGVYGVRIGQFFAGESMFHTVTDASKVALWAMVERLEQAEGFLFDAQWPSPHLESLGFKAMPSSQYLAYLAATVKGLAEG